MLTSSFPLVSESVSGAFVHRLVQHLPPNVQTTVVTPSAPTSVTNTIETDGKVRKFRYAPRKLELLAHRPGGIPVALKNNRLLYLLIAPFLVSALLNCVRHAKASHLIHANWAVNGCIAGLAGKMLKIPVVTTLRGEDVTRAKKHSADRLLLRLCLALSTRVVVVGQSMNTWI